MRVADVMTREPVSCRPWDSLETAAQVMWNHDCGCVPVVDEGNRAVAMITDRDACMAAYLQGKPLSDVLVSSAMSQELHTCATQDLVTYAENTMRSRQVRRLPVVDDDGTLVGILSLNDITRVQSNAQARRGRGAPEDEVKVTLAAIGTARVRHMQVAAS